MKIRKYQVKPTTPPLPLDWTGSGLYVSLWLDAYSVMVSEAERFIVRTTLEAAKTLPANHPLQEDARLCSGQEIQHALAHKAYEDLHLQKKFYFAGLANTLNFLNYKVLEPLLGLRYRLHFVSALEHMNAMLATIGIEDNVLKVHNEATKLYLWHFYEEYEHKDVTFDLLKELGGTSVERAIVMLILVPLILFDVTLVSFVFAAQTPQCWSLKCIKEVGFFFFHPMGFGRKLIRASFKYLQKDSTPHKLPPLHFTENYP